VYIHFTLALLQGQSDTISSFLNKNWTFPALLVTENIGDREVQLYASEQINKKQYHNASRIISLTLDVLFHYESHSKYKSDTI